MDGTPYGGGTTFANVVSAILKIFNTALPVLVALALVLFMIGVVKYIYSEGEREKGELMMWSLIALFVLVSVWGILRVLLNTFAGRASRDGTPASGYSTGNPGGTAGNLPPIY